MRLSPLLQMVLLLGLWLFWSLAASQEICSSPGDLPAPSLLLDKGCAREGDTITLMCFIPLDTSLTRVIFCKDGKEILMLPKDKNKFIFELPRLVSPESAGNYSCRYQHKDDNNQEKNSLPSTRRYLNVTGIPGLSNSGWEVSIKGPAVPLWIWILRFCLVLLLLMSAPIIICILEKGPITQPDQDRRASPGGNGREKPTCAERNGEEGEEEEETKSSGGL